jgi:hypothetical protein
MTVRIRLAILSAVAVVAGVAVAGTGLASAAMARLGAVGLPASAAERPTYVDVTSQFRSDGGWGMAQGLIAPVPVSDAHAADVRALARNAGATGVPRVVAGPAVVTGSSSLRDINLARAGLIPAPGCSGSACGTAGCGFLAPGCAVLDCSLLNPACGLGVPVSACGILDPTCGFGGCGLLDSRCGFGFDERDLFDRRFRFRDVFFDDRHFFDRHFFDRRFHDRRFHDRSEGSEDRH